MKPDAKIRILLADGCGVSSADLARLLPLYRLPAEWVSVPPDALLSETADGWILDADTFDLAQSLAGQSLPSD